MIAVSRNESDRTFKLEAVLRAVYLRYATDHPLESTLASARITDPDPDEAGEEEEEFARVETDEIFNNGKTLDRIGLNKFAQDTNGQGTFIVLYARERGKVLN